MTIALQARGLTVSLGGRTVLQDIDLQITAGRWTCVLGPNGAGKSTLLKALAGLLPCQGRLWWEGQSVEAIGRRERAQRLSWLGQGEVASLDLRVWDVVMLGRLPHQGLLDAPSDMDRECVQIALQATQAWDWRERMLGSLSGGERQRVLLARALAGRAPLMLMDEPLAHLDAPHQVDWLEQVHCLRAQGITVLSVLHEVGMALQADEIVVMGQGRVLHHGASQDPATHAAIEAVLEHRVRIFAVQDQWVVVPRLTPGA